MGRDGRTRSPLFAIEEAAKRSAPPIGVSLTVERPVYDALITEQINVAKGERAHHLRRTVRQQPPALVAPRVELAALTYNLPSSASSRASSVAAARPSCLSSRLTTRSARDVSSNDSSSSQSGTFAAS